MNKYLLNNPYLSDILQQPAALRATVDGFSGINPDDFRSVVDRLNANRIKRVVLTGMGSSYFVLHPLQIRLIEHGIQAEMFETSELIHFAPNLLSPETLLVAVSQSGRSAETTQMMDRLDENVPCIAVTNTRDSLLAKKADLALITRAGDEFSVSCKTYVTALAGLMVLGDLLTGQQPAETLAACRAAADRMAQYLSRWEASVEHLVRDLAGIRSLFLTGRGPSLSAVGTGGLIIKEAAHFHSEGMSSAAFRHGPLEMVSPETFVMVYAGSGPTQAMNANLVADIQNAGGRAQLVSRGQDESIFTLPVVPDAILPLFEILPAQLLSIALAILNRHVPGKFELGTKVTLIP
jgi:glucosamine--fructose-6-phosphate aminotransferase (isomerizing)